MPHHRDMFQIELLEQFRQIVGILVHVIAAPRLTRAAKTTAIMTDAEKSLRSEKEHLSFPSVRRKRPTVTKADGLPSSWTPVLVVNSGTVLGGNKAHELFSLQLKFGRLLNRKD